MVLNRQSERDQCLISSYLSALKLIKQGTRDPIERRLS